MLEEDKTKSSKEYFTQKGGMASGEIPEGHMLIGPSTKTI